MTERWTTVDWAHLVRGKAVFVELGEMPRGKPNGRRVGHNAPSSVAARQLRAILTACGKTPLRQKKRPIRHLRVLRIM